MPPAKSASSRMIPSAMLNVASLLQSPRRNSGSMTTIISMVIVPGVLVGSTSVITGPPKMMSIGGVPIVSHTVTDVTVPSGPSRVKVASNTERPACGAMVWSGSKERTKPRPTPSAVT